jgi:hemin uptake protein HemP
MSSDLSLPIIRLPANESGVREPAGNQPRTVRSGDLLQGQVELLIEHGPDTYRLRLTRSGKLILQK